MTVATKPSAVAALAPTDETETENAVPLIDTEWDDRDGWDADTYCAAADVWEDIYTSVFLNPNAVAPKAFHDLIGRDTLLAGAWHHIRPDRAWSFDEYQACLVLRMLVHLHLSTALDAPYPRSYQAVADIAVAFDREHVRPVRSEAYYTGLMLRMEQERRRQLVAGVAWDQMDLPGLPVKEIIVDGRRPRREMNDEAAERLRREPDLFSRDGKPAWIARSDKGRARVEPMDVDKTVHALSQKTNFVAVKEVDKSEFQKSKDGKGQVRKKTGKTEIVKTHLDVPLSVAKDLLARRDLGLRPLKGIVEAPICRDDASLATAPGYDAVTGLYYDPAPGFILGHVPERPAQADAREALDWLRYELQGDFPYVSGRDNLTACMLTYVCRDLYSGQSPALIIEATKQRTGKGKHAEIVARVTTGHPAPMSGAPAKDEEWDKRILAQLTEGASLIAIDNVTGMLDSPSLARALTGEIYEGRVLGQTKMARAPQRATWVLTGNNVQLGADIAPRCYRIKLDAKTSRPQGRTGFRHEHLEEWVDEHRGDILARLYTIARAWVHAGRPKPHGLPVMGGFTGWQDVIGGMLQYAGADTFLERQSEDDTADAESEEWEAFVRAIRDRFGHGLPLSVAELASKITNIIDDVPGDNLRSLLPSELLDALDRRQTFAPRLRQALKAHVNVRYGDDNLRIERVPDKHAKVWRYRFMRDGDNPDLPLVI